MSEAVAGADGAGSGIPSPEDVMLSRLLDSIENDEEVTLILGSGLGTNAVPRVADIVRLADQYALGRGDGGDLSRALAQARLKLIGATPTAIYAEYRRVFGAWVSGAEFDLIAQQAVLEIYRPPDRMASLLANHGIWQRVSLPFGEHVENDAHSWLLSPGIEALGATLARLPEAFGHRILTTNFDPLLEVAVRIANGRAASIPLGIDGSYDTYAGQDGAVRVYHLHGFWRPTLDAAGDPLLNDSVLLADERLVASTAELINGDTICVLGTSDWAGTIINALTDVSRQRRIRVLWAVHRADDAAAGSLREDLVRRLGDSADLLVDVDGERLLSNLADRLHVTVSPRAAGRRYRVRHPTWERQLVSWPDAVPPLEVGPLVQQLERRFGWGYRPAASGQPRLLFWPVKFQPRASVIHMVQALTAGALARRGMSLVVSLDDVDFRPSKQIKADFQKDLERWVLYTAPGATIEFVGLSDFLAAQRSSSSPEDLLRSIDPWTVAQDLYGKHNPSVYSLLVAIKVVPNFALHEIEENPSVIVQALLRNNTNRLLTPLTMWPFLHHLLRNEQTGAVMTLGGWDEGPFWEQWRQVYGLGISQLYNPYFPSLSHRSGLVRWSSRDELRGNLSQMHGMHGWDEEGSYIPWLFQNALLLPTYLNHESAPEVDGVPLRSWAAFLAAMQEGQPVLDVLTDHASALYLGKDVK